MALITGEVYSAVIKVSDPAAVAGRTILITLGPDSGVYPGCLSTGYDIKFSTQADPSTALSQWRIASRFNYPDGTAAKGNFFAQFAVLMPSNLTGDLLVQWGHAAATDTSDYWAVHQLPNASDCNALEIWQMTEAGATFTGAVSGTALTLSGNATHRQYDDQPLARRSLRIVSGSDPAAKATTLGMYTNTTGYAQAAAGFLDSPPSNITINFGFFFSNGNTGDIIGKYSDANNYFRLEVVTGNKFKLSLMKGGNLTTWTSSTDAYQVSSTMMLTIMMGDAGLEFLINGCPIWRSSTATGVWGSGSGGKFTVGARDTGAVSSILQGMMCMTLGVYSRRLTYGELGYLSYHFRPPLNLRTMADKINYQSVLVDGSGTGENSRVQEFDYLGIVNGTHHAIYHGGTTGKLFHLTGTSVTSLTRDGQGAVLGGGTNGEAGETLAVAGTRVGDVFLIVYNSNNSSSDLKYTTTVDFVTFKTPATLVAKRVGDWPAGCTNASFDQVGAQYIILIEGVGFNPGSYVTGAARGPDLLHLTLDTSKSSGGQFTTASPGNSLMYSGGFGANNGNNSFLITQSGGPFIWRSPNGARCVFFHGHGGAFDTSSMSFIYMRRTWDYINYEESPTEVIAGPMTEVVASADQLADFCITDLGGTIAPIAWGEFFNNGGGISKIAQFTISAASIQDFVTDTPNVFVPKATVFPQIVRYQRESRAPRS